MARSLQELIDFLLNEVAICGDQGVTLLEILKKIDTFYRTDGLQRPQNVDRRFQAKVWSWLTRRHDVLVGKQNEWKHLSFDEVLDRELSVKEDDPPAENPEEIAEGIAEENADSEPARGASTTSQVRIFVSKERAWYAITGHEPDDLKVPASEFALLSIIAARKSDGITQTDLVSVSGQDKRSVPKRTDALATKGYIEKRKIQIRKHRTSLLTLRRFLNVPPAEVKEEEEQKPEAPLMIDFEALNGQLFGTLETSENHIIGRNDLKEILNYKEIWFSRILSRAIRKWEQIGVLRRVRAKSQYGKFYDCVERLRVPTPTDFELFHQTNKSGSSRARPDPTEPDEDMEPEDVDPDEVADEVATPARSREQPVAGSEHIVPSWTPDRNISNQLFDIISKAGTNGIKNNAINRHCFGLYFRRPAECLFHRLTDCWQYSQPPHLRHLAIVRDSDVHKTVIHYVQYSATNFGKKVEQGNAFWEAVEFQPEKHKASTKVKIPPTHAPFEIDEYGLPTNIPPLLIKDGSIGLYEGISCCKPSDYSLTCRDLVGVYYKDGSYRVEPGSTLAKVKGSLTRSGGSAAKKGRPRLDSVEATPSRPSKKQKREVSVASENQGEDQIMVDMIPIVPARRQPQKRSQSKFEKFKHLGKKERFEAMGWDETWTEYSALVMEKPNPGCYVTPPGKRRPVGKKQGRPKNSRIAVFKLPKLSTFPWFIRDGTESEHAEADDILQLDEQSPVVISPPTPEPEPSQNVEPTSSRPRRGKRGQAAAASLDDAPPTESGRPLKQRRVRGPGDPAGQQTVQKQAGTEQAVVDLTAGTRNDTPVSVQTHSGAEEGHRAQEQPESSQPARAEPGTPGATPKPTGSRKMVSPLPRSTVSQAIPMSKSQDETKKHFSADRGGSIPFIRRRIIMDVIEKAGGAYPAGSELWYPFATAWMKLNYQEKPDSRTLVRTIGHLVDAGQIQKLTYSAKDSRGVMVTKTILKKPDLAPDDPLIQRMQSELAIFERDMRIPFAPDVEINQTLSKHTNSVHKGAALGRQTTSLPFVSDSFRLRSKPIAVLREEERNKRRVEKEWQDQLYRARYMMEETSDEDDEIDYGDYDYDDDEEEDEEQYAPGIYRLIRFPPPQMDHGPDFGTHLFRPHPAKGDPKLPRPAKIKRPPGRPRMLDNIFTTHGKMMFLLNPGQIFFPATGTFGTGSIHHRRRGGIPIDFADIRANIHLPKPNHVAVLRNLARQHMHPTTSKGRSNTDTGRFARVTERILRWELDHPDMQDVTHEDHPFIEHHASQHFYPQPVQEPILFDYEQPKPLAHMREKVPRRRLRAAAMRKPGRRERKQKDANEGRSTNRRRTNIRPLPESAVRKYMVAIVAVRTLAGGNQGNIVDWDLIPLAFPDTLPDKVVQIARSILNKNRMEILKMQHDFQERYLLAYQQDKVPLIDYRNLAGYDWKAVVEWASVELEFTTSEKVPTLPATREQFDSMFELREELVNTAEEVHTTTSGLTIANKRRLMSRIPFAAELPRRTPPPRKEYFKRLEVAKTWVRANVTTRDGYDAIAARTKLEEFSGILPAATQSLVADRVICTANRGRAIPGRNFMMHDFFLQAMERRRAIDSAQLVRAADFKTSVLDPAFEQEGFIKIDYHGPDGDAVAIGELVSKAQVEIVPINPPRQKYGLMDGGYLTRQMDKDVLRFEMQVRPLPSYVYGNPILSIVDDTPAPGPTPTGHCPLWVDIHSRFIPDLWRKAVASVLGSLVLRSGISSDAITFMCKPGLMKWEIELLLEEWLLKVGVVRKSGSQERPLWSLCEWWWLVLKKPETEPSSGVPDAIDAPGAPDAQAPLPIDPMLTAS